jgi:hypothetical protein
MFALPYVPKKRKAEGPVATFSEWNSKADQKGYADL